MSIVVYGQTQFRNKLIEVTPASWKQFQELIQRGGNLWPDAPPAIKEFIDVVTVGHVQQDYFQQANVPRPGEANVSRSQ